MNEEWRDIFGYEGLYQVSNLGRVRSLDKYQMFPLFAKGNNKGNKTLMTPILRKGKLMKLTLSNKTGYFCVGLWRNNVNTYSLVHRLVAQAFIKTDDLSLHINHKDFNKINNHVSNLEWCTKSYNTKYNWVNGRMDNLDTENINYKRKFSKQDILDIRQMKKDLNCPNKLIADKYKVGRRSIDEIIAKRNYKWVI